MSQTTAPTPGDRNGRNATDPLGLYALLGVGPLADQAELRTAWRRQAKLLHPDFNPSDDAAERFRSLRQAWKILGDPRRRSHYDALLGPGLSARLLTPDDPAPAPLRCLRCGKITAQPRIIHLHRVKTAGLRCKPAPVDGIFCRDCADRTAIVASTVTWLQGWWSLSGPWRSLRALLGNLRGGQQPRSENFTMLMQQARAFAQGGCGDLAWGVAEQARPFAAEPAQLDQISHFQDQLGLRRPRRLKDRWRRRWGLTLLQTLPLLGLLASLSTGTAAILLHSRIDTAEAPIQIQPVKAGETRHVAVEVLKVRQSPSSDAPVLALLDHFSTVDVQETTAQGQWARVITSSGVGGYVPSRLLFGGMGEVSKYRWCADQKGEPPGHGEVLTRRTGGADTIRLRNDTGMDALIRLKTLSGRTVVAAYLFADSEADISGLPSGSYRLYYATGDDYSRACGLFLSSMNSYLLPGTVSLSGKGSKTPPLFILPAAAEQAKAGQTAPQPLPLEGFLDQ